MRNRRPAAATNAWLDVPAAARYATVRPDEVLKAIARRDLPAVTTHPDRPGAWMMRREDVEAWISKASAPRSWNLVSGYPSNRMTSIATHPMLMASPTASTTRPGHS